MQDAIRPYTGARGSDAATLVVKAVQAYLGGDWQPGADALERDAIWEAIGGSNEERALLGSLSASASAQIAAS